ncbi:MAG: hypothetical protein ACI9LX_004079, partial [Paraglaciecola sp.]
NWISCLLGKQRQSSRFINAVCFKCLSLKVSL